MVSARAIGGVIIPLILPALDIGIIDLVDRHRIDPRAAGSGDIFHPDAVIDDGVV